MPETFPALSVYLWVGISLSASEADARFCLSIRIPSFKTDSTILREKKKNMTQTLMFKARFHVEVSIRIGNKDKVNKEIIKLLHLDFTMRYIYPFSIYLPSFNFAGLKLF